MEDIDDLDLSKAVNWVANIAKQGDSRIITVPKSFWENKIIDDSKVYRVFLVEIGEKRKTS